MFSDRFFRLLLPLLLVPSCSIKEDRAICPCALTLELAGLPVHPVVLHVEGEGYSCQEIQEHLNRNLIEGVRILEVYQTGEKLKHLAYLSCELILEYDRGITLEEIARIRELFTLPELIVEKKGKNGMTEQNIIPMIREIRMEPIHANEVCLNCLICCQNPTLNPAQLVAAIEKYLPELGPDFVRICRKEIYNTNQELFR